MITDSIINNQFIENNLINIIPSSILLDTHNNIVAVSEEVCQLLSISLHNVKNKNITEVLLTKDSKLEKELDFMRSNGFFNSKRITIQNKYQRKVEVELSGFYLGILSDFSDYIIIGVRDVDKIRNYKKLLDEKASDFNELVYRTYHDLRGPAATIKGLVNISNYNQNIGEYKSLINLIDESTNVLNERLSNISLIFDNGFMNNRKRLDLNSENIKSFVLGITKEKLAEADIDIIIDSSDLDEMMIKSEVFQKVLRYSINGFLSLHKVQDKKVKMRIAFTSDPENFLFSFEFEGFSGQSDLFEKAIGIKQKFSKLINDESEINFYLLRNLIQNYKGIFIPQFEQKNKKGFKIALDVN